MLLEILLQLLVGEQTVAVLAEQVSVQMLDLVAEAAGGKAGAFDLKRVAVPILCADFDMVRALDDAVPLRQAQTALTALLLAVPVR